jgi:hypothetical protein
MLSDLCCFGDMAKGAKVVLQAKKLVCSKSFIRMIYLALLGLIVPTFLGVEVRKLRGPIPRNRATSVAQRLRRMPAAFPPPSLVSFEDQEWVNTIGN